MHPLKVRKLLSTQIPRSDRSSHNSISTTSINKAMGIWFPVNKIDTTLTNTTSNKVLDQYSEATLTEVCTLTVFETHGLPHYIPETSISLMIFNNLFILF